MLNRRCLVRRLTRDPGEHLRTVSKCNPDGVLTVDKKRRVACLVMDGFATFNL